MYLKLPATYADPNTGMPMPDAVLVILDAAFNLRGGSAVLQTRIYSSEATMTAAKQPVSEGSLPLSIPEINAQQPGLLIACYRQIAARAPMTGSTVIP